MSACTLPCTECSGGPTSCTSCDGSTPYLYSNTCRQDCPSNTYEDSGVCYGKLYRNLTSNLLQTVFHLANHAQMP